MRRPSRRSSAPIGPEPAFIGDENGNPESPDLPAIALRSAKVGIKFSEYAEHWLDEADIKTVAEYRRVYDRELKERFGSLDLGEVTRQFFRGWLRELRRRPPRPGGRGKGRTIAPSTVTNYYIVLRTIFESAVDDELIEESPIRPGRKDLPTKRDADPTWRKNAYYLPEEAVALCSAVNFRPQLSLWMNLQFYFAGRSGELAGLTWSAYDTRKKPFGRMAFVIAWSTARKKFDTLKNDTPRDMPVHPRMAERLERWRRTGWRECFGRDPEPTDLILPVTLEREDGRCRPLTNTLGYRWARRACQLLGIRERGPHIARATFCTMLQAEGVPASVVETLAQGSPSGQFGGGGRVLGGYTRFPWQVLCDAIAKLKLEG